MDIYHILFIHSSIGGHSSCFYHLTILNKAAMNMDVDISVRVLDFNFFEYTFRNGIVLLFIWFLDFGFFCSDLHF